jgi:hypothetical protein
MGRLGRERTAMTPDEELGVCRLLTIPTGPFATQVLLEQAEAEQEENREALEEAQEEVRAWEEAADFANIGTPEELEAWADAIYKAKLEDAGELAEWFTVLNRFGLTEPGELTNSLNRARDILAVFRNRADNGDEEAAAILSALEEQYG